MIGVACKTVNVRKAPLCNNFLEDVSIQSPVTRIFKVSKAIGNLVLIKWDPCGKQGNIMFHYERDNSEDNVIQAQVCTALAHNSDHVGVVSEDLNGAVLNDVQKGFKTDEIPTFLAVCCWMCHATTQG